MQQVVRLNMQIFLPDSGICCYTLLHCKVGDLSSMSGNAIAAYSLLTLVEQSSGDNTLNAVYRLVPSCVKQCKAEKTSLARCFLTVYKTSTPAGQSKKSIRQLNKADLFTVNENM